MTQAAERVRVVRNVVDVGGCARIREIDAISGWGGFASELGYENNERSLRKRVATLGGNTLLILQERGGAMPVSIGEAYRCP